MEIFEEIVTEVMNSVHDCFSNQTLGIFKIFAYVFNGLGVTANRLGVRYLF